MRAGACSARVPIIWRCEALGAVGANSGRDEWAVFCGCELSGHAPEIQCYLVSVSVSVWVSTTPIPTPGRERRARILEAFLTVLNVFVSLGKRGTSTPQASVAQLVE